jgi:EpsI family protein
MGTAVLGLGGRNLTVRRLVGQLQSRREPITYWVTLNDRAVLPGFSRKVEQIMLGLRGQIPDGMLIRVSSLTPDPAVAFSLQEVFLNDLLAALPPELQSRYFGAKAA